MNKVLIIFTMIFIFHASYGQEIRVWTNGEMTRIDTFDCVLPEIPDQPNIRYVEFSDFVVETKVIQECGFINDSLLLYDEKENKWRHHPVRIIQVEPLQIIYRFTMPLDFDIDTSKYERLNDSMVNSVKYIMVPSEMELPKEKCLLWCEARYKNCYYVREVVDKDMVFMNRFSDYAGSVSYKLSNYPVLCD